MKDMESAIQAKDVEANSGKNKPLNRSTTAFNDIAHKNSVPLAEWSSSKLEPIDATLLSISFFLRRNYLSHSHDKSFVFGVIS